MITTALTISLIVLFLHACTWDGMILAGVKKIIKPEGMLYKPIYGCPICMTPWWGTIIGIIFFPHQPLLLTIAAAAGFSVLWVLLIDIKDYLKPTNKS